MFNRRHNSRADYGDISKPNGINLQLTLQSMVFDELYLKCACQTVPAMHNFACSQWITYYSPFYIYYILSEEKLKFKLYQNIADYGNL